MAVRREGSKLCVTYPVRGYHTDVNGHVNNAQYLHYLEAARDDFVTFLGITIPEIMERRLSIVLSEVRLKFIQPARFGDQIDVWGWLSELGRVAASWTMEIRRAGAGELLAEAWLRAAFVNERGRVIPIPPDMRARLETIYLITG